MRNLLLLALFCLTLQAKTVWAQTANGKLPANRSKYLFVKDFILVNFNRFENDKPEYEIDSHRGELTNRDFDRTIYVASKRETFNVGIRFFNPLIYSIDLKETGEQDDLDDNVAKFANSLKALNTMFNGVSMPTSKENTQISGSTRSAAFNKTFPEGSFKINEIGPDISLAAFLAVLNREVLDLRRGDSAKGNKKLVSEDGASIMADGKAKSSKKTQAGKSIGADTARDPNSDAQEEAGKIYNRIDSLNKQIALYTVRLQEGYSVDTEENKPSEGNSKKTFSEFLAQAMENLSKAQSLEQFSKAITDTRAKIRIGIDREKELGKQLAAIEQSMTVLAAGAQTDYILKKDAKGTTINMEKYRLWAASNFFYINFTNWVTFQKSLQKSKSDLIDKGMAFLTDLDQWSSRFEREDVNEGIYYYKLHEVKIEPGEVRRLHIVVKKRTIEYNAADGVFKSTDFGTAKVIDLVAVEYNNITPEFGPGVVFSPALFPKWVAGQNGPGNPVARKSFDTPGAYASSFLNLSITAVKGNALPMMQIGASFANNRPTVFAGAGLRIFGDNLFNSFSLSVGAMMSFARETKSINEGDALPDGQKTLDDDLHYVPQFHPYFGIQYNL